MAMNCLLDWIRKWSQSLIDWEHMKPTMKKNQWKWKAATPLHKNFLSTFRSLEDKVSFTSYNKAFHNFLCLTKSFLVPSPKYLQGYHMSWHTEPWCCFLPSCHCCSSWRALPFFLNPLPPDELVSLQDSSQVPLPFQSLLWLICLGEKNGCQIFTPTL